MVEDVGNSIPGPVFKVLRAVGRETVFYSEKVKSLGCGNHLEVQGAGGGVNHRDKINDRVVVAHDVKVAIDFIRGGNQESLADSGREPIGHMDPQRGAVNLTGLDEQVIADSQRVVKSGSRVVIIDLTDSQTLLQDHGGAVQRLNGPEIHRIRGQPFIWTATAKDILEKVKRGREKLNKLQTA